MGKIMKVYFAKQAEKVAIDLLRRGIAITVVPRSLDMRSIVVDQGIELPEADVAGREPWMVDVLNQFQKFGFSGNAVLAEMEQASA